MFASCVVLSPFWKFRYVTKTFLYLFRLPTLVLSIIKGHLHNKALDLVLWFLHHSVLTCVYFQELILAWTLKLKITFDFAFKVVLC